MTLKADPANPKSCWKNALYFGTVPLVILFIVAVMIVSQTSPVEKILIPLTSFSSVQEVPTTLIKNLPPEFSLSPVLFLAFQHHEAWESLFFESFIRAQIASGGRKFDTILVPHILNPPPQFFGIRVEPYFFGKNSVDVLSRRLQNALAQGEKVLVVSNLVEGSQRSGFNVLTALEENLEQRFPVISLANLMLDPKQEAQQSPQCQFSASDNNAHVYDLSCLILKYSREQRLSLPSLQKSSAIAMQIDPHEIWLGFYEPLTAKAPAHE